MAASTSAQGPDYFGSRPLPRSRPSLVGATSASSPRTPRTPLISRSISGQFNSPGASFSREQEEIIVYELHPRFLSAGLAGESTPRCVHRFGYQVGDGRRVGDYREFAVDGERSCKTAFKRDDPRWTAGYELFHADVRNLDLGLVDHVLERAVRAIHTDYLQLDMKPRRTVLAIPSLLSTPILDIALRVLFNHYAQPPTITLLSTPVLACVGAGLRNALVVEIGWEETVVTAIGEYKAVAEKRTTRGGKMLTLEIGALLEKSTSSDDDFSCPFTLAEDVTQRMAWCENAQLEENSKITIPIPNSSPHTSLTLPFSHFAVPVDTVFFSPSVPANPHDDNDLPLSLLVYRTLLSLPVDLRATCMSRIILTGSSKGIPGLKHRLLRELSALVEARGWDQVHNYGSAKAPLPHRLRAKLSKGSGEEPVPPYRPPAVVPWTPGPKKSVAASETTPTAPRTPSTPSTSEPSITLPSIMTDPPTPSPFASPAPAHSTAPDDLSNPLSQRVLRNRQKGKPASSPLGVIRSVETLGAWAGASLFAGLTKGGSGVKGVVEVERDEFLKSGVGKAGEGL